MEKETIIIESFDNGAIIWFPNKNIRIRELGDYKTIAKVIYECIEDYFNEQEIKILMQSCGKDKKLYEELVSLGLQIQKAIVNRKLIRRKINNGNK